MGKRVGPQNKFSDIRTVVKATTDETNLLAHSAFFNIAETKDGARIREWLSRMSFEECSSYERDDMIANQVRRRVASEILDMMDAPYDRTSNPDTNTGS